MAKHYIVAAHRAGVDSWPLTLKYLDAVSKQEARERAQLEARRAMRGPALERAMTNIAHHASQLAYPYKRQTERNWGGSGESL